MSQPSFKIGKEEFSFKTIDLKTYYLLQELLHEQDRETDHKVVSALTDCPVELLRKLKYKDWLVVWEEAQLQINNLVGNADTIQPIIKFEGQEWGLVRIEDMTVGEFADLDLILTSPGADKKLESIAAIIYRPIIKRRGEHVELEPYDVKTCEARQELFLSMPLTAIKSANSFFLQYADRSLKSTLHSFLQMEESQLLPDREKAMLEELVQSGLGGESSIFSLEQILFSLQKLRSYRSDPLLTGLPGKKKTLRDRFSKIKNKLLRQEND